MLQRRSQLTRLAHGPSHEELVSAHEGWELYIYKVSHLWGGTVGQRSRNTTTEDLHTPLDPKKEVASMRPSAQEPGASARLFHFQKHRATCPDVNKKRHLVTFKKHPKEI